LGTSSLAVSLAIVASNHHDRVALIDGAPRNGLEVLLGVDEQAGPTWQDLARIEEAGGSALPRRVLSGEDPITVVAWQDLDPIPVSTVRWAVDLVREHHDLVIADVGSFDSAAERQLVEGSGAIALVVPGELRALTHAVHLVPVLLSVAPVHLVVARPSPSGITDDEVADLLNLPIAAVLEREPKLAVRGEHSQLPTRRLRATAQSLLAAVGL
jgi:hypothetical protein